MPRQNCFRHQTYVASPPATSYRILDPSECCSPQDAGYDDQLSCAWQPLSDENLQAVYLVHGTFTGNDALGLLTELQRFAPELSESIRRISKEWVDVFVREMGNYTRQFARTLEQGLQSATGREIPVHLFHWSSQNNHIGRADGAVRLIARLAELAQSLPPPTGEHAPPRVMLWGHSHGGNVLALVTNLLAAPPEIRQRFFDTSRIFFSTTFAGRVDMPVWHRVEKLLTDEQHPVRSLALDIVTFGTPIRYGWDTEGYSRLLHFVNHRPQNSLPEYLTRSPLHLLRMMLARDGDYVHQIGIAGTNLWPLPLAWRTFRADCRLKRLLQRDLPREWLLTKLGRGQRVPDEATTLLVNYHDSGLRCNHMWGHAVYTRREWLPFHLREISREFANNAPPAC